MNCKQCGAEITEKTRFCPTCGTSQVEGAINISTPLTDWKNSFFDGGLAGLIGVNLLTTFVTIISLGFAFPAMYCYRLRWIYRHTVIGGYRLKFNGKGIQLFGSYLLWNFLSIITFGVFSWWIPIKYKRWELKHVEIESQILTQK